MNNKTNFEIWLAQHGNKKNADVKRIISIMNAFLSNDTVKQALYLGSGLGALALILHFLNERHEMDLHYENLENNKEEE